jgi:cytochrome bd-type quinol oxidase subunit 2
MFCIKRRNRTNECRILSLARQILIHDVLCEKMKKIGTWYLVVLTGLLFLLGRATGYLNHEMTRTYQIYLEGRALPALTDLIIRIHPWPYMAAALSAAFAAAGFATPIKSRALLHIAFWIVALAAFILLATAFAYCFPFVPIVSEMTP